MTVIQIRGTSGSGKTTVVKKLMEWGDTFGNGWDPFYVSKRRLPLLYQDKTLRGLTILGHYESPCGGGDTIGSGAEIVKLIQRIKSGELSLPNPPTVIIVEGLLLSEDVKWSSTLSPCLYVFLTTPINDCIERVKKRRKEVGNDKPFNPSNTENRVGVIDRARERLIGMGLGNSIRRTTSVQAPSLLIQYLEKFYGQ